MVIESAEKFGLSQLHQLRGRVGRGAEQSYCILLTGPQLSRDATERMNIMVQTNDGFLISEKDLEIRGPGDIEGTRQSGVLQFKLANIIEDKAMLETARNAVLNILEADPKLESPAHLPIVQFMTSQKSKKGWGKIA
jgi:ATP-dependent DNA helicase RecG